MNKSAGVGRYAFEMLRELDELIETEKFILLTPEYAEIKIKFKNIKIIQKGNQPLLLWKNIELPLFVRRNQALLVDLTQAFPFGVRGITCIHDCMPELSSSSYKGIIGKTIRRALKLIQRKATIKKSKEVITVSQFSKNDIIELYKIPQNKITVLYSAWQHIKRFNIDDSILEQYKLKKNEFYFSLGSKVPHKNIEWVLAAAKQNRDSVFIISGENDYCKKIEGFIDLQNVIFTGYISNEEIKSLMLSCKAFIYPSLYEGFGLPPLEAMALGRPVIVSNAACLPEIYGDSAHYIDPENYIDINLEKILEEPVGDSVLTLNKYSWIQSAESLLNLITKTAS